MNVGRIVGWLSVSFCVSVMLAQTIPPPPPPPEVTAKAEIATWITNHKTIPNNLILGPFSGAVNLAGTAPNQKWCAVLRSADMQLSTSYFQYYRFNVCDKDPMVAVVATEKAAETMLGLSHLPKPIVPTTP